MEWCVVLHLFVVSAMLIWLLGVTAKRKSSTSRGPNIRNSFTLQMPSYGCTRTQSDPTPREVSLWSLPRLQQHDKLV